MLRRSLKFLVVSSCLAPLLASCAGSGLGDKLPPLAVHIPQDCERLASPVAHAPVVVTKSNAQTSYWAEYDRLDTANDRLVATRNCQASQRQKFGAAKK